MKIHLFSTRDVKKEFLEAVYELLSGLPGPYQFSRHSSQHPKIRSEVVTWDELFQECESFRSLNQIPEDDFIILLTGKRNENNWFSASHTCGKRSIFIQTTEWDTYINCNPIYPVAFQVIENVIQMLVFPILDDGIHYFHDPAIGCMFDMCGWKSDITYKLRTADICQDCIERMQEKDIKDEMIQQTLAIIEKLRKEMLFSRKHQSLDQNDSDLPFPVAITRRKMNNAIEPFRKFLMMIDHVDSLVRMAVFLLSVELPGDQVNVFYQNQRLLSRPSLGIWFQALKKLTTELENADTSPFLTASWLEGARNFCDIAEQDHIVNVRNEERGHGYIHQGDTTYQTEFEKHITIVGQMERLLHPLFIHNPIYFVENTDKGDDLMFTTHAKLLMGSHLEFMEKLIEFHPAGLQDIPTKGRVYIFKGNASKWLSIHPYICYNICPDCRHERVLIRDGDKYLDPYIGHRVTL